MRSRHVLLALVGITALAAAMRLLPFFQHAAWGSDTGEYYALTQRLVDTGRLSTEYDGWGIVYAYFTGAYVVSGAVSAISGLDAWTALRIVVPLAATVTVPGIFLVSRALFGDDRAALASAALLAVLMPHVFTTSHPMPGALGHVFMVGALVFMVQAQRDRPALVLAAAAALALVPTHHFTVYFLLLVLVAYPFLRGMLSERDEMPDARPWFAVAAALAVVNFVYWWFAAPPFLLIVRDAIRVAELAVVGFFVVLAAAVLAIRARRKRRPLQYAPAWMPPRQAALWGAGFLGAGVSVGVFVFLFGVPGTSVHPDAETVAYFLPLLSTVSLMAVGLSYSKGYPQGLLAYGWTIAIFGSFLAASAAQSTVLLPYRHTEYLAEPVALLAGLGFVKLHDFGARLWPSARRGVSALAVAGLAALVVLNAATAYPPPRVLAGFEEATSHEEFAAIRWAGENLVLSEDAVVAADHRVSSLLFGVAGLNATWDYSRLTFHGESFEEAREEMERLRTPSGAKRIDYVFLGEATRQGVALLQWENAEPMSQAAVAKFERAPFIKLCDSGSVQIYAVDWHGTMPTRSPVGPCRA
ncbi:MAG TPA: hypothetical protein VM681_00040 [Candidatus Thermoplasmatota archaeon]|nr:hypothetical protein [Candidatus Thermoplasmatota archaeon]